MNNANNAWRDYWKAYDAWDDANSAFLDAKDAVDYARAEVRDTLRVALEVTQEEENLREISLKNSGNKVNTNYDHQ